MAQDPVLQRLYATTDAAVWAEEFLNAVRAGAVVDFGFMIGWFANAMATAEQLMHRDLQREAS